VYTLVLPEDFPTGLRHVKCVHARFHVQYTRRYSREDQLLNKCILSKYKIKKCEFANDAFVLEALATKSSIFLRPFWQPKNRRKLTNMHLYIEAFTGHANVCLL
jgi:hypothetical protein